MIKKVEEVYPGYFTEIVAGTSDLTETAKAHVKTVTDKFDSANKKAETEVLLKQAKVKSGIKIKNMEKLAKDGIEASKTTKEVEAATKATADEVKVLRKELSDEINTIVANAKGTKGITEDDIADAEAFGNEIIEG